MSPKCPDAEQYNCDCATVPCNEAACETVALPTIQPDRDTAWVKNGIAKREARLATNQARQELWLEVAITRHEARLAAHDGADGRWITDAIVRNTKE